MHWPIIGLPMRRFIEFFSLQKLYAAVFVFRIYNEANYTA